MKLKNLFAAILAVVFGCAGAQAATTLLPNGKQCFNTVNGAVSSGSINMFIPNTVTPKSTWRDSAQSALNTQPISLDMNGCAVIYGVGSYRQQLFDGPVVAGVTTGNLIWDQISTDTSAFNSVFWAGIAGGTPNVITITDTGFNATDGSVVQFVALATNTGSTTINPSGFSAILVQKSTTAGPISLIGGEIVAGNVISAVYSASSNTFQLLNAVIQSASGATAPLCGATGLKITNGSAPSTIVNLVAGQAVMQTAAGITINRSNVSLPSINTTTGNTVAAPNGMDGEAPGTSQWLNIWIIDNGAAPAGLISTSATSPTLPSGYTYKCRLGTMFVDGSGNLLRTLQAGASSQYVVTASTNTAVPPVMVSTAVGTYSSTAPIYASASVSGFVPPTATRIKVLATNNYKNGSLSFVLVAPNSAYGGANNGIVGTSGLIPPLFLSNPATASASAEFVLESTNIWVVTGAAGGAVACLGWTDNVNAN